MINMENENRRPYTKLYFSSSTVIILLWGNDYGSDWGYVAPGEGEITPTIKSDFGVTPVL